MDDILNEKVANPLRKVFLGAVLGWGAVLYSLVTSRESQERPIWSAITFSLGALFVILYLKRSWLAWLVLLFQLQLFPAYWVGQYLGYFPPSPLFVTMIMFILWAGFAVWVLNVRRQYFEYVGGPDA